MTTTAAAIDLEEKDACEMSPVRHFYVVCTFVVYEYIIFFLFVKKQQFVLLFTAFKTKVLPKTTHLLARALTYTLTDKHISHE